MRPCRLFLRHSIHIFNRASWSARMCNVRSPGIKDPRHIFKVKSSDKFSDEIDKCFQLKLVELDGTRLRNPILSFLIFAIPAFTSVLRLPCQHRWTEWNDTTAHCGSARPRLHRGFVGK